MKQLIRHILREHTREIDEVRKKTTTPEFIEKAKSVHGDKYDYSDADYKGSNQKVQINCRNHGKFFMTPSAHITQKQGCPECGKIKSVKNRNSDSKTFIEKAKKIHNNDYDYSNVDYKGAMQKVSIYCPKHEIFFDQIPASHLSGRGCPKCGIEKIKNKLNIGQEEFIKRAKEIHGDKYDYSLVEYVDGNTPVKIICKKHNKIFKQQPGVHVRQKSGCPICGVETTSNKLSLGQEGFLNKAKEIHGDKYDYSLVNYKNQKSPVEVICKKHKKPFLVSPTNHIGNESGCPLCSESKGEILIDKILKNFDIDNIRQKVFEDCTNKLDKFCRKLPFDFYLPNLNTIIEYDGQQHFKPVWGHENLKNLQRLDKLRNQYCEKNGIKLIRIPYTMKKEEIEPYILKELGID